MSNQEHKQSITFTEFPSRDAISSQANSLLAAADKVLTNSYSPYSQFKVAAAVLMENGEILTGTNQENSAYPSGLCAERVAVFYAKSKFPELSIKSIAISVHSNVVDASRPVAPCGTCRQVMLEYELNQKEPIELWLSGSGPSVIMMENVAALLPLHFYGDSLKKG